MIGGGYRVVVEAKIAALRHHIGAKRTNVLDRNLVPDRFLISVRSLCQELNRTALISQLDSAVVVVAAFDVEPSPETDLPDKTSIFTIGYQLASEVIRSDRCGVERSVRKVYFR